MAHECLRSRYIFAPTSDAGFPPGHFRSPKFGVIPASHKSKAPRELASGGAQEADTTKLGLGEEQPTANESDSDQSEAEQEKAGRLRRRNRSAVSHGLGYSKNVAATVVAFQRGRRLEVPGATGQICAGIVAGHLEFHGSRPQLDWCSLCGDVIRSAKCPGCRAVASAVEACFRICDVSPSTWILGHCQAADAGT